LSDLANFISVHFVWELLQSTLVKAMCYQIRLNESSNRFANLACEKIQGSAELLFFLVAFPRHSKNRIELRGKTPCRQEEKEKENRRKKLSQESDAESSTSGSEESISSQFSPTIKWEFFYSFSFSGFLLKKTSSKKRHNGSRKSLFSAFPHCLVVVPVE
jgi:hypothetical protein